MLRTEGDVYGIFSLLKEELRLAAIQNIFGIIRGSDEPDRFVILGNHRDAWTYGAVDPNSGTAVLLDIAHRFGVLVHSGWRPRRTIVLCSWDAEEYGMVSITCRVCSFCRDKVFTLCMNFEVRRRLIHFSIAWCRGLNPCLIGQGLDRKKCKDVCGFVTLLKRKTKLISLLLFFSCFSFSFSFFGIKSHFLFFFYFKFNIK